MDTSHSVTLLIRQAQSQNRREYDEAARILWQRYSQALLDLAQRALATRVRQRQDEEDVLQMAYTSFCLRHRRGEFDLHDRDDLWRLLVTITEHQVIDVARAENRRKRDARREENAVGKEGDMLQMLGQADPRPGPEMVAALAEQTQRLLAALDPDLQQIAHRKLAGMDNDEISRELGVCQRTVRRKLDLIRRQWEQG